MAYPATLDSFTNPVSPTKLNSPLHDAQHSGVNDAAEALEAKVGVNGSAVTTSHDYKLSGVTGTDKAASLTGIEVLTNKTLTSPVLNSPTLAGLVNDWVAIGTGTYFSPIAFKVSGNFTDIYRCGDRIRLKQGGAYKYFYMISCTYSAPNTTFGIQASDGNDLDNAVITDLYLSKSPNPVGFPPYFNFSAGVTYSGGTTDPTSNTNTYSYFSQVGKLITFALKYTLVRGTGDRTTTIFGLWLPRNTADYVTFTSYTTYNSTPAYGTAYSDVTDRIKLPVTMNQDGVAIISGSYWTSY